MAIKYYSVPEQGMVVGVLNNTATDAIHKIEKITDGTAFCAWNKKYMMPNQFRAVAKTYGGDQFDEEVGKNIVKEKLMKRYYKSFDAKMDMFCHDLMVLNGRVFRTPDELKDTP